MYKNSKIILGLRSSLPRLMAKSLVLLNKTETAIKYYEKALENNPKSKRAYNDLLKIYEYSLNWELYFKTYQNAIEEWPTIESYKLNCAIAYMYSSRYREAKPLIENYIQRLIGSGEFVLPNIYSKLGICYAYLNQWDLADNALSKAEKEHPWDVDMVYGRICLFNGTNRVREVLNYLDKKINNYPHMYPFQFWKADFTRYVLRQPEKSVKLYESALKAVNVLSYNRKYSPYYFVTNTYCDPGTVLFEYFEALSEAGMLNDKILYPTLWWLGKSYNNKFSSIYQKILKHDYESAIKACNKLLRKHLSPAVKSLTISYLAMAQSNQGKLDQALKNSINAAALDSDSLFTADTLGSIYIKLAQWEKAADIYLRLSNEEPFTSKWFEKLGLSLKNIGDLKKAKWAYEQVIRLDPNNLLAMEELKSVK